MAFIRRPLPFIALLVVVGVLYLGYRYFASRPPLIETTEARTEDVARVLAVTGRIKPRLANKVQPLISGKILTLTQEEGAAVRRGEVLATLDAETSRAMLQQATAQLDAQRASEAQLARDYSRASRLVDAGGIAPREAEAAKTALDASRAAVRQLEALVRESRSRSRDFTLVSPIDGYVLSRPVDPGQNVTPQTVIYELATSADAEIEVDIDEQYLSELRVGLEATVAPLTGALHKYKATVVKIGRRVSESSGAVPVRLDFAGDAPHLPAGLSVDVNLMVATHPRATTISRAAVAALGASPYVMLVQNDTLVRQPVTVIDWPSPRIVVTSGVKPGDIMALTPRAVRPGEKVRAKPGSDAF